MGYRGWSGCKAFPGRTQSARERRAERLSADEAKLAEDRAKFAAFKAEVEGNRMALLAEIQAGLLDPRGDEDLRRPWLPRHEPRTEPATVVEDLAAARARFIHALIRHWKRQRRTKTS